MGKQDKQEQEVVRRWTQWREPEARAILREWRRSGLSADAFARSRGFSSMRLWYWQKRLGGSEAPSTEVVKFVALAVPSPAAASMMARQIEIEHGGVRLRVREDLDVAHVARLVSALAGVNGPC